MDARPITSTASPATAAGLASACLFDEGAVNTPPPAESTQRSPSLGRALFPIP